MLLVKHCDIKPIKELLKRFSLNLKLVSANEKLPGSFWGDDEAGLVDQSLYVNNNTPIHSLLHETCHFICMDSQRRNNLDTNAGGDYDEENAVCYLQIILADSINEMSQQRIFKDMDAWGYSFRLGSAQKWFEEDAEDAQQWLLKYQLINHSNTCLFSIRI